MGPSHSDLSHRKSWANEHYDINTTISLQLNGILRARLPQDRFACPMLVGRLGVLWGHVQRCQISDVAHPRPEISQNVRGPWLEGQYSQAARLHR
jgi:hypothetical protein